MNDFRVYNRALTDFEIGGVKNDTCPKKFGKSANTCVPCSSGKKLFLSD